MDSVLAGLRNTSTVQRRFRGHLLGLLLRLPGHATFRNLSRYSPYHEKTFSRWFTREVDWVSLNTAAIRQRVPASHAQVVAFDPRVVPKRGRRTAGLDRFWNRTQSRAPRGLESGELAWVEVTANTAYHVSAAQTLVASTDAADQTRIDAYRCPIQRVVAEHDLSGLK